MWPTLAWQRTVMWSSDTKSHSLTCHFFMDKLNQTLREGQNPLIHDVGQGQCAGLLVREFHIVVLKQIHHISRYQWSFSPHPWGRGWRDIGIFVTSRRIYPLELFDALVQKAMSIVPRKEDIFNYIFDTLFLEFESLCSDYRRIDQIQPARNNQSNQKELSFLLWND